MDEGEWRKESEGRKSGGRRVEGGMVRKGRGGLGLGDGGREGKRNE